MTAIAFAEENADAVLGINEARLPLCFDCRDFPVGAQLPPPPELFAALLEKRGVHVDAEYLNELLEKGRCVILLDGLDEVPGAAQRRVLLDWLLGLSATHSEDNRFLITCRDAEWQAASLPYFARARVLQFSLEEAQSFLQKWRSCISGNRSGETKSSERERRFSSLADQLNDDFELLYSNPMLLTLAAILLSIDVPLPRKRSHIIKVFVLSMLGEWQSLKVGIAAPENVQREFAALRRIAFHCVEENQSQGRIDGNDARLLPVIGDDVCNGGDVSQWLEALSRSSGLIQALGEGLWAFTNRRILEFLAAVELAGQPGKWHQYWAGLAWKDVLSFVPELVDDGARHLLWVDAQGAPTTDMQALFLLLSVIECKEANPTIGQAVVTRVGGYVLDRCYAGSQIDDELARRYMQIDQSAFMRLFKAEASQMASEVRSRTFVFSVLRAGYLPAASELKLSIAASGPAIRRELIEALPSFRPSVQTILLGSLMLQELDPDSRASVARCGVEALEKLIALTREDIDVETKAHIIDAISEFSHPRATSHLTQLLSDELFDADARSALERNLSVIGAEISEAHLSTMLNRPYSFYQIAGKRCFDLVVAATALLTLLPLLMLLCLLVKTTSKGAVFVRTKFVGREGKVFKRLRFRTVRFNESLLLAAQSHRADPRLTKVGLFLRRTALDELPGLWSVVRGQMALVGPRPLPPEIILSRYEHGYDLVAKVRYQSRPGLLGMSRLEYRGRGSLSAERETARDLHYAANCSFILDLRILWLSVGDTIFPKGAY